MGARMQNVVKIINSAEETVWLLRQQFFFRGLRKLNETIGLLQQELDNIVCVVGEEFLGQLGIAALIEAQEMDDEILVTDILEGQVIPCLESIVQSVQQQESIDQIDFLEGNLNVLRKRGNVSVVEQVEKSCGRQGCTYIPEYTASGQITIRLVEGKRQYYVSGNNNPYRDAMRFVQGNLDVNKYQYVILGAGMLYEAEVLLQQRPDGEIVVVEEDPYLLRLILTYRDLSPILCDTRLTLACCEFEDYIAKANEENQCILIKKPSLKHMQKAECRMVLERFFVKSMTVKEQAYVLEKEFRQNMRLENIRSIDECRDRFRGRKVYLVAGGPSLDETIDVLCNREDESILLCVGTSAAKLKREGIVPDFVIITDVADGIREQIYQNVDPLNTDLLYMISANAKAVSSFEGAKYAIFQKGFDMAEEYAKEHGFMLVDTGGSVTTTAMDICIQFGCDKVVCLGLDFAYTNNMTHASGTRGHREVSRDEKMLMVESVSGDMIPTTLNLSCYHKWIENRIYNETRISFVNISDGAYIHGMENVSTKDRWNL